MKVEPIYTGCLAETAYYIESAGRAAVINPLCEVKLYLDHAGVAGANIDYIFQTHVQIEGLSGYAELARKTGATIVFGPTARPAVNACVASDGDEFVLGELTIRLLHTPGHSPEASMYLLIDENGKETVLFTGEMLLIGDGSCPVLVREDLAGSFYDSFHQKIKSLPDDLVVYPGRGAGRSRLMSPEITGTLGDQKRVNYTLRMVSRDEFIRDVTTGRPPAGTYFPQGQQALSPAAFEAAEAEETALILDVREAEEFSRGFIPYAINIGLNGPFAASVGTLVPDLELPILLVAPVGKEAEAMQRLARAGYTNCLGYLKGGFAAWQANGQAMDAIESLSAESFADHFSSEPYLAVLDVRPRSEFDAEHIIGVNSLPLELINDNMDRIDRNTSYCVYCTGGYYSVMAISILKARGFTKLIDVVGGFAAIKQTGLLPLTDYVRPKSPIESYMLSAVRKILNTTAF